MNINNVLLNNVSRFSSKNNNGISFKSKNDKSLQQDVIEISGKETNAKIFAKEIEDDAILQIQKMCDMPVFKHAPIRIMPDVSVGRDCVVGFTVKLTPDKIKELPPSIIGNDIGCGVLMVKTNAKLDELDFEQLDKFIRSELPTNKKLRPGMPIELQQDIKYSCDLYGSDSDKVFEQAGTLGNGNHFIELDVDEDKNVYLAIHTGSRQFGSYIKDYYEKLYKSGQTNNDDMNYAQAVAMAQKYAKFNRESIAKMILEKLKLKPIMQFDCPHNYIADNGVVHKGSIDASLNQPVLIPLNMRDGMILARGKGNEDWNCSAPHGSGRKMSRTDARKVVDLNEYVDSMRGIYSSCVGRKSVDEAPQAYKDSNKTLDLVSQTVDIENIIRPVYNFKNTR